MSSVSDETGRPLAGKVAVVTGASSGIGRAIALELARAGARVFVHARKRYEQAEATAAAARALGVPATVLLADLAEVTERRVLVEAAWSWQGGVDVWVNNAGADVLTGAAAHWSFDEKLAAIWRVDVEATIWLSREVGRRMRAAAGEPGHRVILNMGWDQALHGMAGDSGEMFAAAKGAIMAFSRSLARSLAPQVRVNCLAPGWIRTAWGENASNNWQERAVGESLMGRWGTPADVARVACFLASPAASFVTCQIVAVNGGFRSLPETEP